MLISFSPKYSISYVMGYLKGKEQPRDFRQTREFKVQVWKSAFLGQRIFCGYCWKNKQRIQEYIKRQLEQDQIADQLSLKEFTDPFTGSKGTKA